jgi:uncharacterized membrane protein
MRLPNQIQSSRDIGAPSASDGRSASIPIWFRAAMAILAAAATGFSGYLAWLSLTGDSVVGCGGGGTFDCEHVLATRWSTWFGVPIAMPAVALYGSILAAIGFLSPIAPAGVRRIAWWIVLGLSAIAGLTAVWFVGLQVFAVGRLCWPCLATHSCGISLAILAWSALLWASRRDADLPSAKWVAAAGSFAAVAVLVGGQLVYEPQMFRIDRDESPIAAADGEDAKHKTNGDVQEKSSASNADSTNPSAVGDPTHTAQKPPLSRPIKLRNTDKTFDVYEHPILGSPDAEHVIVEMFDYTCHYCRDQHAQLEEARKHFGDRLAVLTFPTPLNGRCNSFVPPLSDGPHEFACNYARLAVSVWLADRTKFAEFHEWLFTGKEPPPLKEARAKVQELVGQKGIDIADNSPDPIHQVEQYTNLFGALNGGKMPKLIDEHMLIDGRFRDGKQMIEVLAEQWKLRK